MDVSVRKPLVASSQCWIWSKASKMKIIAGVCSRQRSGALLYGSDYARLEGPRPRTIISYCMHDEIIQYKVISAPNLGIGPSDQDSISLAPCRMEVLASSKIA